MSARVYRRGDRGLHGYGRPMRCQYGSDIEVYESSSGGKPCVWLKVDGRRWLGDWQTNGSGFAHLDARQVCALIARLEAWQQHRGGAR